MIERGAPASAVDVLRGSAGVRYAWRHYAPWIIGLHVVAFLLLWWGARGHAGLWGMALLAYTLGLRHAFNADHIAAIDNTVRKLLRQKKNPVGVGFYFSLGHSTVVFAAALAVVFASRWLTEHMPVLKSTGDLIGTLVSGAFLVIIGVFNLLIWIDLWRLFWDLRRGAYQPERMERLLESRGFLSRFVRSLWRFIGKSWHVYFLGLLFGFGFDTASQVSLLALAAGGATVLSWAGILSLPLLFAAGMVLMDTADGVFMTGAYSWALNTPLRKVYYNLTITGITVIVALLIGGMELMQVIADKLGLEGGFWSLLELLEIEWLGYAIVGLFAVTFAASYAIWKWGRIEERWSQEKAQ
ncbi:MAG: HoxN/HupN/NixA family nickel/cobalt transporter [Hydrogenibacillus schlegelii]|nr:HoxN/HupN/NixA family nickel/cobalt transporter [Hydrogenibacillus schlegelii]